MLSFHGLVIIASEITREFTSKDSKFCYLNLEVASENRRSKTTERHKISISCSAETLFEAKSKLQIGAVCEIIHGELSTIEYDNKFKTGEKASAVNLSVNYKNMRFLKIPMYYEGLKGLTEEGPQKQGED